MCCLILFFFLCRFHFFYLLFSLNVSVLVSEGGDSVSNQMLGHATPTDLAVLMEFLRPSLWVRCVPACNHTPTDPKKKKPCILYIYLPVQPILVKHRKRLIKCHFKVAALNTPFPQKINKYSNNPNSMKRCTILPYFFLC